VEKLQENSFEKVKKTFLINSFFDMEFTPKNLLRNFVKVSLENTLKNLMQNLAKSPFL